MREYINFKSILVAVLLLTPCSSLGDSLLEKKLEPKILNSTHYLEYNFSEYYKK